MRSEISTAILRQADHRLEQQADSVLIEKWAVAVRD